MFESSVSFIVAIEGNDYMSSRQIAELCSKRHDNVLADCEALKEFYGKKYENRSPEISGELMKSTTYKDKSGKSNKCFLLSRDAVLDLITGYSIEHRHTINQAWLEYERKAKESQKPLSDIEWVREMQRLSTMFIEEREALDLEQQAHLKTKEDLTEKNDFIEDHIHFKKYVEATDIEDGNYLPRVDIKALYFPELGTVDRVTLVLSYYNCEKAMFINSKNMKIEVFKVEDIQEIRRKFDEDLEVTSQSFSGKTWNCRHPALPNMQIRAKI
jgi:hypothetical protein